MFKVGDILPVKMVIPFYHTGEKVSVPSLDIAKAQGFEVRILETGEYGYRVQLPKGPYHWVPEEWLEPKQPGMWYYCRASVDKVGLCRWGGWLSPLAVACPRCGNPLTWEVYPQDIGERFRVACGGHLFINKGREWRFRNVKAGHLLLNNGGNTSATDKIVTGILDSPKEGLSFIYEDL